MKRKHNLKQKQQTNSNPTNSLNNAGQVDYNKNQNTNESHNLALPSNSLYQLPMELLTSEFNSGITSIISSLQGEELLQAKISLAKTCGKFRFFLKPGLNEDAVNQFLLPFVLKLNRSDINKAIALFTSNPDLLFITGCGEDFSGRKIKQSPFQAALSTGNIGLLKEMEKSLTTQEQKENALQDLNNRLDGVDERKFKMLAEFKEVLVEVIAAIDNDPCVGGIASLSETQDALEKMREILCSYDFIEFGEHFPLEILCEMFRQYNQKLNSRIIQFNWDGKNNKQQCFSCDVIGYVLRFCTADDMLRFKQVKAFADFIVNENELLSLSFDFMWRIEGVNTIVFPLDSNKNFRLGFEFFLNIYNRDGDTRKRRLPSTTPAVLLRALEKLINDKTQYLEQFRDRLTKSLLNAQDMVM